MNEERSDRGNLLLIIGGLVVVVSAAIAGLVIFSSGKGSAPKPDTTAAVSAGAHSLTMGPSDAGTEVVVYEDLAGATSRSFDIASRDFLEIFAAEGRVRVEYQPFTAATSGYAHDATSAWGTVLDAGTPRQALRFRQELYDEQPAAGERSPRAFIDRARSAGIEDAGVLERLGTPDTDFLRDSLDAARAAKVGTAPVVLVDGRPLTAATPVALADALQRRLLATGD